MRGLGVAGGTGGLLMAFAVAVWADHGGGASPARAGAGFGLAWLLVAGGVLAVALAGWALLAPDRDDSEPDRIPHDVDGR